MNREELSSLLQKSNDKHIILQLGTGFGKTKLALEYINRSFHKSDNILIVIPRLVLIDNWKEEIAKWGFNSLLSNIVFTTYVSLHKYAGNWKYVIFDEAHHLSERCREILSSYNIEHGIFLSATLKREHIDFITRKFTGVAKYAVGLKEAIESNVLPKPKVYLIPMNLDTKEKIFTIIKKGKKDLKPLKIQYKDRFKFRYYTGEVHIECTQSEYYTDLSNMIEWYKNRGFEKQWLFKSLERLKWLAEQKMNVVKQILKSLKSNRSIIFCASIKQSEELNIPCVNSKKGTENLDKFNNRKINRIAVVNMLDEGINLINCRVGLFQMINSSDRLILQRQGRSLRHKNPIFIFPYYKNTREEEIINRIIMDYDKDLIEVVGDINNFKF